MIDFEMLSAIMPNAAGREFVYSLNMAMQKWGVDTPLREAMFLAQAAVESAELNRLSENLNYTAERLIAVWPKRFTEANAPEYAHNPVKLANLVYASRNGNGDADSGDGYLFRGRGVFQLTGRNNYRRCGSALNLDLLGDPELLTAPEHACNSAGWFWNDRGCNAAADARDVFGATKLVNGGATDVERRDTYYRRALKVLGG